MKLTEVSKTAIFTLRCRVIESGKAHPILHDPMAEYCLDQLASLASVEEKALLFDRELSPRLTNHIAIRARKYDSIANAFISQHSPAVVVNLGCGFDTRFWRIDHQKCTYYDLDLPEMIEIKQAALKERLDYEMIGCSVLDPSWIERVTSHGNRNILLLAEGLFMYLPQANVVNLFKAFSERLEHSQIALEVVTEKYTRGIWKKIVEMKIRNELGLDAGSSYSFGVQQAEDVESFAEGLNVIDEWSYLEDDDVRPKIFKYLRMTRTQWTIRVAIHDN